MMDSEASQIDDGSALLEGNIGADYTTNQRDSSFSDIEILKDESESTDSIEVLELYVDSINHSQQNQSASAETGISEVFSHDPEQNLPNCDKYTPPKQELLEQNDLLNDTSYVSCQDGTDTITLKSSPYVLSPRESSSQLGTPMSYTSCDSSSHSEMGYTRLQESAPSSCSPSPYQSPMHKPASSMDERHNQSLSSVDCTRPDSLSFPRPLQHYEKQKISKKESYSSLSEYSSRSSSMDALIEAATSTPLHAQGTISVEGNMVSFVAHGINELIKRSRGMRFINFSIIIIIIGYAVEL